MQWWRWFSDSKPEPTKHQQKAVRQHSTSEKLANLVICVPNNLNDSGPARPRVRELDARFYSPKPTPGLSAEAAVTLQTPDKHRVQLETADWPDSFYLIPESQLVAHS